MGSSRTSRKWLPGAISRLLHLEMTQIDVTDILPQREDYYVEKHAKKETLLLGKFGTKDVYDQLLFHGVVNRLKESGFEDLKLDLAERSERVWEVRLYDGLKVEDRLIGEAFIHDGLFKVKGSVLPAFEGRRFPLIFVQWLCLQNPGAKFTPERSAFPGQRFPGLKMAGTVIGVFAFMAQQNRYSGLANTPEYLHNAMIYSSRCKYFSPDAEARLQALMRDMKGISPVTLSWAQLMGCLHESDTGTDFRWFREEQILPFSQDLIDYFESTEYRNRFWEVYNAVHYRFDEDRFERHNPLNADGSPKVGVEERLAEYIRRMDEEK